MPDFNSQIAAGADDARERSDGVAFSSFLSPCDFTSSTVATQRWNSGFRFDGVTIPKGVEVSSATLELYLEVIYDDPNCDLDCEDVDDAPDFVDTADINDRVLTGNPVSWVETASPGWYESPSFHAAAESVFSRGGWASGQALVVIVKGKSNQYKGCKCKAREGSTTLCAKLHITYAAGPLQPTGIASGEAFGSVSVVYCVGPTGIPTVEAFGTPGVSARVAPASVASVEAFGTLSIVRHLHPSGIASAEAFGYPHTRGGNSARISVNAGPYAIDSSLAEHLWRTSDGKLVCVYQKGMRDAAYNVSLDNGATWVTADEVIFRTGTGAFTGNDVAGIPVGDVFYGAIGNLTQSPYGIVPFKIVYTPGTETFEATLGAQVDHSNVYGPQVIWNPSSSRFLVLSFTGGGYPPTLFEFDTDLVKQREKTTTFEYCDVGLGARSLVLLNAESTVVGVSVNEQVDNEHLRTYTASGSTFTESSDETGLPSDVQASSNQKLISAPSGKVDLVYNTGSAIKYARRNGASDWDSPVTIDSNAPRRGSLAAGGVSSAAIITYRHDAAPGQLYYSIRNAGGVWATPVHPTAWEMFQPWDIEDESTNMSIETTIGTLSRHAVFRANTPNNDLWHLDLPPILRIRDAGSIASAEGFGTLTLHLFVPAGSVASGETFGSPTLVLYALPTAIASTESFGTPTIAVHVHPSGVASVEALGSPVVAGPLTITTGIASAEAFGTAQLNLQIVLGGISSAEALGTLQVSLAVAGVGGIASVEAFGTLTVAKHTHPSSIASTEALGSPVIAGPLSTVGIVSEEVFGALAVGHLLHASGIASLEAHGTPTVAGPITVAGIATVEAFGAPQVNLGAVAGGIASVESFGTATLTTSAVTVSPTGIASAEGFGAALIAAIGGPQSITVSGIASVEAFGTALLAGPISATGIASAEALGSVSVSTGAVTLQPDAIASAEAFGTLILVPIISPSGLASAEAFGTLSLSIGGPQTLILTGIASAETFGTLIAAGPIAPTGIASAEAVGTLTIGLAVSPSGIASAEAFGTLAVSIGSPQSVSPSSVASLEAFGAPIVVGPLIGAGIASSEAFGTAEITIAGIQTLYPSGVVSVEAFGTASVGPSWVPFVTDDGTVTLLLVQDGSASLPEAVNDGTISIKETEDATI